MTIEISAPAPASSTNARPTTHAQNSQMTGEAPPLNFLSLLGSLGLGAAVSADAATANPAVVVVDAPYPNDGLAGAQSGHDDDKSQPALAQLPLAAQWWAAAAPAALDGSATPALQAFLSLPDVAAVAAPVAGPLGHHRAAGQAPGPGLTAALAQARATEPTQQPATEAALSEPAARLSATSELQQLPALAQAARQNGDATPVSSRDFMARMDVARLAADPDTATLRAASTVLGGAPAFGQVVSMFDAAAAGLRGAGAALRSQERGQPRMAGAGAAQGMVTWGDATPVGTQHGASAAYAQGALTPAPATAMAEKVHYWVSRGVQSASLQLDAFAGGSVDVSIAVKGDQAIIEFRTDQPHARQLLLEAMPQLKELLAGEGLMLSGGFVGTSAQQGGQSQSRATPQMAARETLVGVPQAAPGRAAALDGASGGRVDLFV